MQDLGLSSIRTDAKRIYIATKKKPTNILQQNFKAQAPNKIWISDVTCFKFQDNWYYICAVMESFFSSMKRESLYRREYSSEAAFRKGVFQYIEFYNTMRPHSILKQQTPAQFEQAYYEKHPVSRQGSDC